MASNSDRPAGGFETENSGGLLTGFLADFLAEEEEFDGRALLRLGTWGAASVSAVIVALLANQSSVGWRREQVADLARQSQQIQSLAKASQSETRQLASAIETLNGDRDRLYSRVTVLEQGLDSVTGAIAQQKSAAPPQAVATAPQGLPAWTAEPLAVSQNPVPVPVVAPVASTPAAPAATGPIARENPPLPPQAVAAPPAKIDAKPDVKTEPQVAAQNPAPAPALAPLPPAAPAEKPAAIALAEPSPAPVASAGPASSNPPAATPAMPLMAAKSLMAPPDTAASKLIAPAPRADAATSAPMPEVVAAAPSSNDAGPDAEQAATLKVAVKRTEFGADVGGANSLAGLRALWRGLLKSNKALANLHPIVVVKESNSGLGMQLRLIAGPLSDAAAAAKICAGLIGSQRSCETAVFDGQSLAMKADEPPPTAAKPAAAAAYKRGFAKREENDDPPQKPETFTFSSFFGMH
jgi:hypothetical protein